MLFDEDYISSALARVCNSDGATLGTAFFVVPAKGIALTCHHLVPTANEQVFLDCGDGKLRTGTVSQNDRFPDIDLAVIRDIETPPVNALPIVAEHNGITRFWTKGFHYYGQEIVDSLPTSGEVEGETSTRFSGPERDYFLSEVLVLKTDLIDSGLSGAPVLDPETGVAFALVNAKFGCALPAAGLALPFAVAKTHSVRLKDLFEANTKTVPRYGRFLNCLGALEICRQQRRGIIGRLAKREFYLPDMYCERAEQEGLTAFYDSDSLILPIIGNAGVGKTMLLADVARRSGSNAAVLLLGRDLRSDESELSIALTSRLRERFSSLLGPSGDASLLITALQSEGRRLIVIFDGLNEIPSAVATSLQGWIDRSVTWLEESNSRLIVSSRPEYWQTCESLFPRKLTYSIDLPSHASQAATAGLRLGDFSDGEATLVRKRYHLGESIALRHIQHPLMARIYWELQTEVTQGKVVGTTRHQALQRFIKQKCDRIALAAGSAVLSSHVESCLREAARITLESGGFEIEDQLYFSLFAGNSALADQFVHEGLFMTTSGGKRFTFDEIAEFVQSKLLNLETILQFFSSATESSYELTTGAIVYTILRLDEEGKDEEVEQAIRTFVSDHTRLINTDNAGKWGRRTRVRENVVVQLLQEIQKPARFMSEFETFAANIAQDQSYHAALYDPFGFRLALARSGMPQEFKLNLLRKFLLKEDSYDFEHHHWHDLEHYVISRDRHTGAALAELIQSSPVSIFGIMTEWLSDETKLREGKSNVADAAMALMFFHRHLAFDSLCELAARSVTHKAGSLLGYIAKDDPVRTLDTCLKWTNQEDPVLRNKAALLAKLIAGQTSDNKLEDKLYEVLAGTIGRANPDTDVVAKTGIGRLERYRPTVVEDLVSLFKQGHEQVGGYAIAELAATHFDLIALATRELITSNAERSSEAICALSSQQRSPLERNTIIDLMHLGADNGLLRFLSFRYALEYLLPQAESTSDVDRMFDLVEHMISVNSEVRLHLMYFACSSFRETNSKRVLQDRILELLVTTETDLDNEARMLEQLAANCGGRPSDLKNFLAIGKKMPVEEFHRALFAAAYQNDEFAKILAGWLEANDGLSPFGPTQSLLDRVRRGEKASEAASHVMDEILDL